MARRLRIAAVGEITEDVYLPDGPALLGGISVNFARAAIASGAEAAVFAAVGDDERGARVMRALTATGIDTSCVVVCEGPTATQRVRIGEGGERVLSGYDAGVVARYRLSDGDLASLARYDAIALVAAPETDSTFRACLGVAGPRLVADFSKDAGLGDPDRPDAWIAPFVDRLDVAFVGGEARFRPILERVARQTRTTVVLTAGADGAWAFAGERALHQPALATAVVDTTGCGDAFQGAFTVAWLTGAPVDVALARGAESAARIASRVGAG